MWMTVIGPMNDGDWTEIRTTFTPNTACIQFIQKSARERNQRLAKIALLWVIMITNASNTRPPNLRGRLEVGQDGGRRGGEGLGMLPFNYHSPYFTIV